MNNGIWTVTIEEDEDGNAVLPFDPEMLAMLDWREGDTLDFQVNPDNSCTITNISWTERQVA